MRNQKADYHYVVSADIRLEEVRLAIRITWSQKREVAMN